MKKTMLIIVVVSINFSLFSQPIWSFDKGFEGWSLDHSVSGNVEGGIFSIAIIGSDSYILSPNNLAIDAIERGKIKIRMQNLTPDTQCQLFWITDDNQIWDETKSVPFTVKTNDTALNEYTLTILNDNWAGTIKQIRLDFGNSITSGNVKIDQIEFLPNEFVGIDNGTVHLRLDLSRGGAIAYISKSGIDRNIVNVNDEGRYIQQAYYAGNDINRQNEGQRPVWSPWPWNIIQAGDTYANKAQILDYSIRGDTLYTKCIPKHWDMNNKSAEAIMEQTTILKSNVIKVTNKITCLRTDAIYGEGIYRNQELPAVFPISALNNLYSYFGTAPFTNAPLSNPVVSVNNWGIYDTNVSEKWLAFVDNNLWGLGVYNPMCSTFAAGLSGRFGEEAHDASTCYMAPIKQEAFNKNTVYEYTYYLVIGDLNEIRSDIYTIHKANQSLSIPHQQKEKNRNVILFPNPATDVINIDTKNLDLLSGTIDIIDVQSRLMLQENFSATELIKLNLRNLSNGIYLYSIKNEIGKTIINGKFIKN